MSAFIHTVSVVQLLLVNVLVYAQCTSTTCQQGETSSGEIGITLHPNEEARIWGLSNMILEKVNTQTYQATISFCVFSSTGHGRIFLSSRNNMNITDAEGRKIDYTMWVSHTSDIVWQPFTNAQPLTFNIEGGNPKEPCNSQKNIRLRAEVFIKNVYPQEGHYTDVITLTFSPQ